MPDGKESVGRRHRVPDEGGDEDTVDAPAEREHAAYAERGRHCRGENRHRQVAERLEADAHHLADVAPRVEREDGAGDHDEERFLVGDAEQPAGELVAKDDHHEGDRQCDGGGGQEAGEHDAAPLRLLVGGVVVEVAESGRR